MIHICGPTGRSGGVAWIIERWRKCFSVINFASDRFLTAEAPLACKRLLQRALWHCVYTQHGADAFQEILHLSGRGKPGTKNSTLPLISYYGFFNIWFFFCLLPGSLVRSSVPEATHWTPFAKKVTHMADITAFWPAHHLSHTHRHTHHACLIIHTKTRYSRDLTHSLFKWQKSQCQCCKSGWHSKQI